MVHIFVRQKVSDYQTWKSVFDSRDHIRVAGGEQKWWISHVVGESNNLVLWFEWDTLENARKYFDSPELKDAGRQAGVLEEPETYFLEEVAHGKAHMIPSVR
ncbi:MAG: hypothetical protein ACYC9O_14500 [Candidatus Latescibacterota bacterium]